MEDIKEKIEKSCCFLCLQSLSQNITNNEQINITKSFFKLLKTRHEIEAFVCEKCGENLTNFVKLSNLSEKVRMEMDYLLNSIKSTILNSNHCTTANFELASARGIVLEKCLEQMGNWMQIVLERLDTSQIKKENDSPTQVSDCPFDYLTNYAELDPNLSDSGNRNESSNCTSILNCDKRKPQIILQRLDISKLIKRESNPPTSDCTDDWSENSNISNLSDDDGNGTPAAPFIDEMVDVKCEVASEKNKDRRNRKSKAKCPKCSKTFRDKYNLTRHKDAVHLRLKPFKCPTCHKSFFDKIKMRIHINAVHLRLKKYKMEVNPDSKMAFCEICKKKFATERLLQLHNYRVHTAARFPCEICKRAFKTLKDMRMHVAAIHEKQRKHCQVPGCDKTYSISYSLSDHYIMEHPDFIPAPKPPKILNYSEKLIGGKTVFECKYCGRALKSLQSVNNHLRKMHLMKKLICEDCSYTTRNRDLLMLHVERRHSTGDGIECKICKKKFSSVNLLQIHSRNSHGPKKFKCEFCGVAMRRKDNLNRHVKKSHKGKQEPEVSQG